MLSFLSLVVLSTALASGSAAISVLHPVLSDASTCSRYVSDLFALLRDRNVDYDSYPIEAKILMKGGLESLWGTLVTTPDTVLHGLGSLAPATSPAECTLSDQEDKEHEGAQRRVATIPLQLTNLALNASNVKFSYFPSTTRYSDVFSSVKSADVNLILQQRVEDGLLEVADLDITRMDDADMFIGIYNKGYHSGYDMVYPILNGWFQSETQAGLRQKVKQVMNEYVNQL